MKTKLKLYKNNDTVWRVGFNDYSILAPVSDAESNGAGNLVCGDFVGEFLTLNPAPPRILLTYTDKSPKEKGFKKVVIKQVKVSDYGYEIFISGKLCIKSGLFPALRNKLPISFKEYVRWVKIEAA